MDPALAAATASKGRKGKYIYIHTYTHTHVLYHLHNHHMSAFYMPKVTISYHYDRNQAMSLAAPGVEGGTQGAQGAQGAQLGPHQRPAGDGPAVGRPRGPGAGDWGAEPFERGRSVPIPKTTKSQEIEVM